MPPGSYPNWSLLYCGLFHSFLPIPVTEETVKDVGISWINKSLWYIHNKTKNNETMGIFHGMYYRADSRFASSQWGTALLCNGVSHWLGKCLDHNKTKHNETLGIFHWMYYRADSRFASSQWRTALLCNDVSHWLGGSWPGLILGLRPANERRRYFVTPSHIGWAQA